MSDTPKPFKVGDWIERTGDVYGIVKRGGLYKIKEVVDDYLVKIEGDSLHNYDSNLFKIAKHKIVKDIINDL